MRQQMFKLFRFLLLTASGAVHIRMGVTVTAFDETLHPILESVGYQNLAWFGFGSDRQGPVALTQIEP